MSVAFTKEESAETASETLLPDRPISEHLNLVTEQGFKALERQLQEAKTAFEAAQNAKSLAPEQPLVYRLLSLIHLKQKNYAAALADLDAYIRLDPDSPDGLHAKQVRADTQKRLASSHPPQDAAPDSP